MHSLRSFSRDDRSRGVKRRAAQFKIFGQPLAYVAPPVELKQALVIPSGGLRSVAEKDEVELIFSPRSEISLLPLRS